jgi:hypothetical protein
MQAASQRMPAEALNPVGCLADLIGQLEDANECLMIQVRKTRVMAVPMVYLLGVTPGIVLVQDFALAIYGGQLIK